MLGQGKNFPSPPGLCRLAADKKISAGRACADNDAKDADMPVCGWSQQAEMPGKSRQ